jgi:DNA-binding PadR family transcriptional regulator
MDAGAADPDPLRETFLEILRHLNQIEFQNEGKGPDQALELGELETKLAGFWAVRQGSTKVALALGLLLRNGLIQTHGTADYSWQRGRPTVQRYQITSSGKQFLLENIDRTDRIG